MNNFTNNFNGGGFGAIDSKIREELQYNIFNGELKELRLNRETGEWGEVYKEVKVKTSISNKSIANEAKEIILNAEYKRGNNERIIPTGDEVKEKGFSDMMWCYLQSVSNYNLITNKRYVSSKYLSPTKLMKVVKVMKKSKAENGYDLKCISRNTATNNLNYLKSKGYILETPVDGSEVMGSLKGEYFELKNEFKYYSPLENEFIKALTSGLAQEALRVYLVYYGFNNTNEERTGTCILDQEEIMRRAGLSNAGKNYEKLRSINEFLRAAGLIVQEYLITRDSNGVEVKRNLATKAPLYWESEFYKRMKHRLKDKSVCIRENTYTLPVTDFDEAFRKRGRKKKYLKS